jgi:hypothetical protein
MMTCPNCGAENREGAPFCRMCAAPLDTASAGQSSSLQSEAKASQIVCPVCKTSNEPDWAFCQECGYKLTAEKPKTEPVQQKPQTEPVPPPPPPSPPPQPFERETLIMRDGGTAPINKPIFDPAATVVDMQIPPLDTPIPGGVEPPTPPKAERVPTAPVSQTSKPPAKTEPTLPPVPPPVVPTPPPVGHQTPLPPPVPATVAHTLPPEVRATIDAPMSEPKPAVSLPSDLTTAPNLYKTSSDEATTIVEDSQNYTPVLTGNEVVCPKCAHKSAAGSLFCANCGGSLAVQTPPPPVSTAPPPTPMPTAPTSMPTQPNAGQTMVISSMPAPSAVQGKLHLVMEGGQAGEVYDLKEDTGIGRTTGEIVFPHDGYMSGRHSRIVQRGSDFFLSDEGSRNGTFVRIKGEVKLEPGDMILVGKQLFRFEK